WRDAVGGSTLSFHVTNLTLVIGLLSSVTVCVITLAIVLRRQARKPARELLDEGETDSLFETGTAKLKKRNKAKWIALGCFIGALATVGWALVSREGSSPETFFCAGSLLLIAGMAGTSMLLTMLD